MSRAPIVPLALLLFGASSPVVGASQMKPDFAAVKSVAAANALTATGKLVSILLFPAEFGGEDHRENRSYVTPEAAAVRARLIGTIQRMLLEGAVDQLTVTPEYKGDSIVPGRLTMKAWHTNKPGSFTPVIDIW